MGVQEQMLAGGLDKLERCSAKYLDNKSSRLGQVAWTSRELSSRAWVAGAGIGNESIFAGFGVQKYWRDLTIILVADPFCSFVTLIGA